MVIKCQKPSQNLMGRLATDYYLENEKKYGKNPLRNISLKKCSEGNVVSLISGFFDPNYELTKLQIAKVWEDLWCEFVGLYADNGYLIAHTTISQDIEKNGGVIALISEIHINQKDKLKITDKLNFVYGIYREIIKFIESLICSKYPCIERIDLVSLADDPVFLEITQDLGYDILRSAENGKQVRFSKYLYERNMTYERRNTNQQN